MERPIPYHTNEFATCPQHGCELDLSPLAVRTLGDLGMTGIKQSTVDELIQRQRAEFVEIAVRDITDPELRAVVEAAANDEFDDKVWRVRSAFKGSQA